MTDKEKYHKISVAYDNIESVIKDSDVGSWDYYFLSDALIALDRYFEEGGDSID